jgi:medium-chain acyl-[acyl-carrier-protein] hydrolase
MSTVINSNPWAISFQPAHAPAARLFCFPYAGGNAMVYRTWAKALPPNLELVAVQLPGRGGRIKEPPFTELAALVEAAVVALTPYFDKPFIFFGHSMGAIIAFEMARRLRAELGLEPLRLLVSGRRAPHLSATTPLTYALPDAEFIECLRRLNGTPEEILAHPEMMQLMIPLLRADFQLIQTYAYVADRPLGCPISAYSGMRDLEVNRAQLAAWGEHTTADFLCRVLPGDHFFLHTEQARLLSLISQEVIQALRLVG